MKILVCHNYYLQAGGEDQSFASENELLESQGHEIKRFTMNNEAIAKLSQFEVAKKTLFNSESYNEIKQIIRDFRPEIVHCTNIFPLISPSVYYAAHQMNVPVVQSLRNFRLLCPSAYLQRCGAVCELCLKKTIKWPAVWHACYRKSRSASAVVATMLATHKFLGTWERYVTRYFAMTEFAKAKYVEAGFNASKIAVKPNFLMHDPGKGEGEGNFAVFVGRLSPEKGLDSLLDAWKKTKNAPQLKIIGDGPMANEVKQAAASSPNISWLGAMDTPKVLEQMGQAKCLVLPSTWYEGLPRTIIEAFAKGTPVIAFALGAMSEVISNGRTGLLVETGNSSKLAVAVDSLFDAPHDQMRQMRMSCRKEFLDLYSASTNYEMLMRIYQDARSSLNKSPTIAS